MSKRPTTADGWRRWAACQQCRTICLSALHGTIDHDDLRQRCPIGRWPMPLDGRAAPDLPRTQDLRPILHRIEQEAAMIPRPPQGGPGTELKKLLRRIGITSRPGCHCERHAAEMDMRGVDWCRENMDTIVGWLEEEARRRKWPFHRWTARRLVAVSIGRAEAMQRKRKADASDAVFSNH